MVLFLNLIKLYGILYRKMIGQSLGQMLTPENHQKIENIIDFLEKLQNYIQSF